MTVGQRVSGSPVKWVKKSEWVSRDPLTYDQVNKIPRTGYFVGRRRGKMHSDSAYRVAG